MLVGRQQRWCSTLCNMAFRSQHDWNTARDAAKRRDGNRCVRCGTGPHEVELAFANVLAHLGVDPADVSVHVTYRQTDWYRRIVLDRSLEVNHIRPRGGRGYGMGCHHHLTGLETLCFRCHREVTELQRAGIIVAGRDLNELRSAGLLDPPS